ncbi:MAG TPA: presenilin family intramembrane aspartyl protease [Candidatus Nanoarchaeia archaeon]|nr:presenilin family intramembrane aspartyl protease [Candidatus Nanoarchaeia archaeon]
MKHSLHITLIILGIFLVAQFIGLAVLYNYIDSARSQETGKTEFKDLPIGERPPVEENTSFIPVIIAIIIGTIILLVLIKYKLSLVWKLWFLMAVTISLSTAWAAFVPVIVAFVAALIFALWKIFKPNVWVHNFTELFIYGGLAAIFAPLFNLFSMSILLILISIYDAYAVWKSKHMITLAKSQAESKVFAGLLIPYSLKGLLKKKEGHNIKAIKTAMKSTLTLPKVQMRTAILGGGDIGFPLIFAGVVLKEWGLWQSLVIPFFALAGLALLLYYAEEKKFYPAMPFISAGCFVGLGVVWVIGLIV